MQVINTLKNWALVPGILQAIVVGLCLGAGFVVPFFWWLGIVGIMWVVQMVLVVGSYRKLVWLCSMVWFVKSLASLVWFFYAYPIDWVGLSSSSVQIVLIIFYWLSSSLWLASGGVIFALVARFLHKFPKLPRSIWFISVPFLWLAAEIGGATVFSIMTAGPGSFIQSYFSFGMVGYLLGVTEFGIFLAGWVGLFGLTIAMVTLAVIILNSIKQHSVKLLVACGVVIVGVSSYFLLTVPAEVATPVTTVIAIDTQFDVPFLNAEGGEMKKAEILKRAIDEAVALKPTVILLPEDSRYLAAQFDSAKPNQAMAYFQFLHGSTKTILIDSGRHTTEAGQTVLRANVFDGVNKKLWQFDKQYLVPQGEYVPTLYGAILYLLGYGDVVARVAQDSSYRPGPLTQTTSLPSYIPGVLFCFESVSPVGVSSLQKNRPLPFVAHPISHAWFHTPHILWQQLDIMLQIKARHSGVPIVSAGNLVAGKLYLPNGEITDGRVVGAGDRYQLREFTF